MSAIKDGRYPINLRGKDYYLLFSLNALDALQDKFGGYDKLSEIFNEKNKDIFKDLRWLLTLLINEGLEENEQELTEQQVGRLIHLGNIGEIKTVIYKSFAYGVNGGEQPEDTDSTDETEDNEGNRQSAQAN
jgi:hypothetical protein